jgi:AcrR family transcriptional regulator
MTRELLLKEGLELFGAKGYAATTVDDIAAAAGTTRQTFYLHFSSKAELLKELITAVNEILTSDNPTLAEVVASGDREQIRAWLGRKIDQWPEIGPYVTAAHEGAASDAEIQEAIDQWFESAISDIHTGLDRADRFPPSSRRVRGTLAFGQLEFASRRWMRHGWDVDRDETLNLLTESWCALLAD